MKKLTLSILFVLALIVNMNAQQVKNQDVKKELRSVKRKIKKADVPKEVIESFTIIYPQEQVIDWYTYPYYSDIEIDDSPMDTITYVEYLYPEFYEVEFIKEGKTHKSIFSRTGKLLHMKKAIKDEELPQPVVNAIKNGPYKDWTIVGEKEKIEKKATEPVYKVKVEKGKERQVLFYYGDGTLVQVRKIKMNP
jgi:hypothetical protein